MLFKGTVELLSVHIVICDTEVEYVLDVPVLDCTLAAVVEARLVNTADDVMSFLVDCSKVVTVVTAVDSREGEVCGTAVLPWEVLVGSRDGKAEEILGAISDVGTRVVCSPGAHEETETPPGVVAVQKGRLSQDPHPSHRAVPDLFSHSKILLVILNNKMFVLAECQVSVHSHDTGSWS